MGTGDPIPVYLSFLWLLQVNQWSISSGIDAQNMFLPFKYSSIQVLSRTTSTNVFMLLVCLQAALLPSIRPVMKLVRGIELVLKKWFLIFLKENQDTHTKLTHVRGTFPNVNCISPLAFLLQFPEGSGSLVAHFFVSALPACVNHSRKVAQEVAVR